LSAWFQLFEQSTIDSVATGEAVAIEDYIPVDEQESLLRKLGEWALPDGNVRKDWAVLAEWCDPGRDLEKAPFVTHEAIRMEAASSCFLNAYFSLALVLLRAREPKNTTNGRLRDTRRSLGFRIHQAVMEGLAEAAETPAASDTNRALYSAESPSSIAPARKTWINQCHFSVSKVCLHWYSFTGTKAPPAHLCFLRRLVFSLLGRLEKGNESIAAVLFSSDVLFQSNDHDHDHDHDHDIDYDYDDYDEEKYEVEDASPSPISSMFLGEICGSESARKQLDHSFKLQHGFGITSEGYGPFGLDSLLSGADKPISAPSAAKDEPDDQTLPLGRLWLWQCLSGSIRMRDDVLAVGTKEASDVIAAVLGLLVELQKHQRLILHRTCTPGYAERLPLGARLYYLMNVCLHHEDVLRNERILQCGEKLFTGYLKDFGSSEDDILDFCRECLDHSGHASSKAQRSNNTNGDGDGDDIDAGGGGDDDHLEEKDKKLLDDFANTALTIHLEDAKISSEQIRALVAFLEDLTTAYRDYGAQYDFFTRCVRVLLLPLFPSLIRCRLLKELDNMLHLLSLPGDDSCQNDENRDNDDTIELLSRSLSGGLPEVDDSLRDGTDVLNAFAKATASPRPPEGYVRYLCVGTLARNLAIAVTTWRGLSISRNRLERLDPGIVRDVCAATASFLNHGDGGCECLARFVLDACANHPNADANVNDKGGGDGGTGEPTNDERLDALIAKYPEGYEFPYRSSLP